MTLTMSVLIRLALFSFAAVLIERNFGLSELVRGYVGQNETAQAAFQAKSPVRQTLTVIVGLGSMILMVVALSGILDLIMRPAIVGTNPFGLRLLQLALGLGIAGETAQQVKNRLN